MNSNEVHIDATEPMHRRMKAGTFRSFFGAEVCRF